MLDLVEKALTLQRICEKKAIIDMRIASFRIRIITYNNF